jgi:hypothetical protein
VAVDYATLGQVYPAATTQTNLYTVPAGDETVISSLVISNSQGSSSSFRIAVIPSGQTLENKHYIAFDVPIGVNTTIALTIGITLAAGDSITVYSAATRLGFSAFGVESEI